MWRFDGSEPRVEREIEAHSHVISGLSFSPDGDLIATASFDGTARIWDATSGALRAELSGHSGSVTALAFHPSGKLVATASTDEVVVWDVATAAAIARFHGHMGMIQDVAFTANGDTMVTAGADRRVKLWDTALEDRPPPVVAQHVACLIGERGWRDDRHPSVAGCNRNVYSVDAR